MKTDKRHIFLVGPSGVGKTSVGQQVAEQSNLSFVDLDDVITNEVGMSISQYFDQHGESKFREIERVVLSQIVTEQQPRVIATGGGTILDSRNIVAMRNHGVIVYLSALEKDLIDRVDSDINNARPLLKGDTAAKIHELLENRQQAYELAADITVATSNRDIQTVSEAVIRQISRVSESASQISSSIVVGQNILSDVGKYLSPYRRVVLITQETIPVSYVQQVNESLLQANIETLQINVPDGESAKSFESFSDVIEKMREANVPRSACVLALGGGVVGDLAGFVAATYHRGIDVIQVPTTLLAQVDSSIGGKCGINLSNGKNLVGAFHQPKLILADTTVLSTLSEQDYLSGLGEVVKYALLGNDDVAISIENNSEAILDRDPEILVPIIKTCMNQKLRVVSLDPFEKTGLRATLNLGHTLAHAIETQTQYKIAHGQAVAIGLRFAIELSLKLEYISRSQAESSAGLIDSLKLARQVPVEARAPDTLIELMYSDKKSKGDLSFILLSDRGAQLKHDIDEEVVKTTLTSFIEAN